MENIQVKDDKRKKIILYNKSQPTALRMRKNLLRHKNLVIVLRLQCNFVSLFMSQSNY